jgi:hypothetical protein
VRSFPLHFADGLTGLMTSCTLTGADDDTALSALQSLGAKFPFVEWAVLASEDRAGTGRYPSFVTIKRIGALGATSQMMTALHLCGNLVDKFVAGDPDTLALTNGFGRVQLNFNLQASSLDVKALAQRICIFRRPIITQFNVGNTALQSSLYTRGDISNHQVLFDGSGGRGMLPGLWPLHASRWPVSAPPAACGYAGGLGPAEIAAELPRIAKAAAGEPFWVDMESKLRSAGARFNLEACSDVLDQVSKFLCDGPRADRLE